jgi:hypothetical protein
MNHRSPSVPGFALKDSEGSADYPGFFTDLVCKPEFASLF